MDSDRATILTLAEAVADGSDVDWDRAESTASDADERDIVRQLRVLSAIGVARNANPARWGPLEVRAEIGRGIFGTVYRAWDPRLDREVALKLLSAERAVEDDAPRTVHEGRLLAQIRHPNVVTVHGADVFDGTVGIWMEFITGRTLKQIVEQQGPFGAYEAALIGRDICRALAAVHKAGFVHRDVKAQNVMREDGGRTVLMDFGAGERVAPESSRSLTGTPAYLAPELLQGERATARSDLYSLGVLLFFLVSGEFPTAGRSLDELRENHARQRPRLLRDLRPDLPSAFVQVVDCATALNPADRPETAGEMEGLLEKAIGFTPRAGGGVRGRGLGSARVRRFALAALVVAALVAGLTLRQASPSRNGARQTLVAILPFQSVSTDSDVGYLANAVSLELTSLLGHVSALNVVPWSFIKATPGDSIDHVARRTGADMIVDGSIQAHAKADGHQRLQVRVQLFRASSGTQIWTTTLERDLGEFFELQGDIAKQLSERIQIVLARREQLLIDKSRRVSPEAMELYLKARLSWEEYADDFKTAIELFRRATTIEPDFAEAYAGLAECFALQHAYSGMVSSQDAFARVLEHADKAIALDPSLPDAWATRAFAKLALAWDWAGAEADYLQARQLSPSSPTVAASYANYLITMRRFDEAIAVSREASDRSPFSPVISRKLAWAYYVARRYDDAIAELQRTLQIDPSHEPSLTLLARTYALKGMKRESIQQMQAAMRPGLEALAAQVYATAGDAEAAERLLAKIQSPTYSGPLLRYQIAAAYAALGNQEEANRWLSEALSARDSGMSLLPADPMFDKIRQSPGFVKVMDTLKLR